MSEIACDFCGKWTSEVQALVEGPDVRICDECVELCWLMVRPTPDEEGAPSRKKVASSDDEALYCSFCGAHQDEIDRLIGGIGKFICNACIEKAVADLEGRG